MSDFEQRLDELLAYGLVAGAGAGTPGSLCVEQAVALALRARR